MCQEIWKYCLTTLVFDAHYYLHLTIWPLSDEAGYPRLTDLGLCAFVRDPAERLTQHCGTRSYMAPEQSYGDTGYGKVCIVFYLPCLDVLL